MRSAAGRRRSAGPDDACLVERALAGDGTAFQAIMQRYNQRLYRLARSILKDDSEAEDAVQDAYINAFKHLDGFRGGSSLGTWLARITINEALGRLRRSRRTVELECLDTEEEMTRIIQFPQAAARADPERATAQREILTLVEKVTDSLPDGYRTVFVARVIEGLSVEETAELLSLRPETVRTRLHRARQLVQAELDRQIGPVLSDAFPFAGKRCERLTHAVLRRLGSPA
ncbi:MAG TPA: RNA polymerase sigma factor [Methylocella sp.]|nr:RNA polymerase sigma factor [Methylocella sp.]